MKKSYIAPSMKVIMLDKAEIIATSTPDIGIDPNSESGFMQSRGDWDYYED